MADPKGFLKYSREDEADRPVAERLHDWREITLPAAPDQLRRQGARCMDCGIPFCHAGCPLGNVIPDFNDLVWRDQWREALARLHATNNFPELTGRVCPAPCETACVLGINEPAVTIKQIERAIVDRGWAEGWILPEPPARRSGKSVAIIGSGPAGLACAQQLNRAGHLVTVYERADRIGGLLTYGIPDFKLEKIQVQRRIAQMEAEGVRFVTGCHAGFDISADELRREHNAIVLAGGATRPRDLPIPGRELAGVHFAMDFLTRQNRLNAGDTLETAHLISAAGLDVVVIGGGDTGSDCVGTSMRQGARSVTQLELLPQPPEARPSHQPWPYYPMILRSSTSHKEGCERCFSVLTRAFGGEDGRLRRLQLARLEWVNEAGRQVMREIPGSAYTLPADLVLLAMGFLGPETGGLIEQLGVALDERGNVQADDSYQTSVEGVFAAGDMRRGQSLVVWALAEGRDAARGVDQWLTGRSDLPTMRAREQSLARR